MRREPPSHQRRVALAGVDVHLLIGVFAIAVDDVFAVECIVVFERFVRSKAVGIDGERLLLAVSPAGVESSIRLRLSPESRIAVHFLDQRE